MTTRRPHGRSDGELQPIQVPREVATSDLEARLARFAGTADAAVESAEIEAAFGADRLDD